MKNFKKYLESVESFLIQNHAFEAFMDNLHFWPLVNNEMHQINRTSFFRYATSIFLYGLEDEFFELSFAWEASNEGYEFWLDLNESWIASF